MTDKVLSVSIAAYNISSTIRECLAPFLQDGVRELVDVMIVDDGSKDSTAEIAKEYQEKYPDTFRLISKENGGWGSTLNVGMRAARGKYFKQLDGDDYFSHENLLSFLKYLSTVDSDMVYTPFITFDDKSGGILRVLGDYQGDYRYFKRNKTFSISECDEFLPAMHCLTVRTDILVKNEMLITEHCFYTDVEYVLKSYNACDTISFYEKPIYYYRLARDGQSMSLAGVRKHYKDHLKMLTTMLAYYKNNVIDKKKKEIIAKRLDGACNMQYIFYFAVENNSQHKKELMEYDAFLKEEYSDFYERANGKQIILLRKMKFFGYWLIAHQKMGKDRKLKQNIFEGC